MDKGTMRFGSMRDMQAAGLMVADDAIDELFSADGTQLILRAELREEALRMRMLNKDDTVLSPGIEILPTGQDFRGKSFGEWRMIVWGAKEDEVFYLALCYRPLIQIDGGVHPEGTAMDVYFRDGCGRPGLEAPLYQLVLERFRLLLDILRQ